MAVMLNLASQEKMIDFEQLMLLHLPFVEQNIDKFTVKDFLLIVSSIGYRLTNF